MVAVEKVMMPREPCQSALSSSLALLEQDVGITYFNIFAITFHAIYFFPTRMLFFVCLFGLFINDLEMMNLHLESGKCLFQTGYF